MADTNNGKLSKRFLNKNPNSNPKGKFSKGLTGVGVGGIAVDTYLNMKAGDDLGLAATKAVGTGMMWYAAPGLMGAHFAASSTIAGVNAYNQWKKKRVGEWQKNFYRGRVGGDYQDTRRAQTMRQAAVQKIQGSKLNGRSALGGEAQILAARSRYQ